MSDLLWAHRIRKNETKALRILPLISGYRDKDNGRIYLTTDYKSVYQASAAIGQTKVDPNNFVVVLPISKVQSLNLFDFEAYALFPTNKSSMPSTKSSVAATSGSSGEVDVSG